MTQTITESREFSNPEALQCVVNHFKIDERATHIDPALFDPTSFDKSEHALQLEDAAAKFYSARRRRQQQQQQQTQPSVAPATVPLPTSSGTPAKTTASAALKAAMSVARAAASQLAASSTSTSSSVSLPLSAPPINAAGLLPPSSQQYFGGISTNYATALAKASKIVAQAQAGKLDNNTAADSAGDEGQGTAVSAKRRKGEETRK